jgi:hypothetical protein
VDGLRIDPSPRSKTQSSSTQSAPKTNLRSFWAALCTFKPEPWRANGFDHDVDESMFKALSKETIE